MNNDNALFMEGVRANENGMLKHQCPYPKDSHESYLWIEGWEQQQVIRDEWEEQNHQAALFYFEVE
jgi:ribosome modulation factor